MIDSFLESLENNTTIRRRENSSHQVFEEEYYKTITLSAVVSDHRTFSPQNLRRGRKKKSYKI